MIQSVLVQKAINAALQSEWKTAIELNEKLLDQFPEDLDSLNRLARACFVLGDISRSKQIYKEVLSFDPYNAIALKNIKRFQNLKGISQDTLMKSARSNGTVRSIVNFIEEPGKTKVIQLVRLAEPQALFGLYCGDPVQLLLKQRGVHVFTDDNVYIGRLPDDIAFQLQHFIKSGNKYDAFIKLVDSSAVQVFVREMFRTPEFAARPTFSYISDISPLAPDASIEHDTPTDLGEEDNVMIEEQQSI